MVIISKVVTIIRLHIHFTKSNKASLDQKLPIYWRWQHTIVNFVYTCLQVTESHRRQVKVAHLGPRRLSGSFLFYEDNSNHSSYLFIFLSQNCNQH